MASSGGGVPPGFRFHPTDEELLHYYLKKKVSFQKFDMEVIREVDLNKMEPWELQGKDFFLLSLAPRSLWFIHYIYTYIAHMPIMAIYTNIYIYGTFFLYILCSHSTACPFFLEFKLNYSSSSIHKLDWLLRRIIGTLYLKWAARSYKSVFSFMRKSTWINLPR